MTAKSRITEEEKTIIAMWRHFKYVSAATETDATVEDLIEKNHPKIEELWEAVFSMRSARGWSKWLTVKIVSEPAGGQ
jgi:hypothetical protein